VISWELVMIKIVSLRRMLTSNIHHCNAWIRQIGLCGLAPDYGHAMNCRQQATGQQFVFMRAAGMSQNERKCHE
jgi:hypothetical protein